MNASTAPFIATVGEALVDWVCLDRSLSLDGAQTFLKAIGGAPANVSVGLQRLGYPVEFIGGFSTDFFGDWLQATLTDEGVGLRFSAVLPQTNSRQAYVLTDESGNRVLKGFTQAACADVALSGTHLAQVAVDRASVVYWGSVVQSEEPTASALLDWIKQLPASVLKVYDPNYRAVLWPSAEAAMSAMRASMARAHVVKLSDDEITLFDTTGADFETIAQQLVEAYDLQLLVVTLGSQGSLYVTPRDSGRIPAFKVPSVEMTGAGDGFVAGLIAGLSEVMETSPTADPTASLSRLDKAQLERILTEASAVGALATTRPGAMTSLPTREELTAFLAEPTRRVASSV